MLKFSLNIGIMSVARHLLGHKILKIIIWVAVKKFLRASALLHEQAWYLLRRYIFGAEKLFHLFLYLSNKSDFLV